MFRARVGERHSKSCAEYFIGMFFRVTTGISAKEDNVNLLPKFLELVQCSRLGPILPSQTFYARELGHICRYERQIPL
jgi:hypothetical protein